jgi:hypothetical protein
LFQEFLIINYFSEELPCLHVVVAVYSREEELQQIITKVLNNVRCTVNPWHCFTNPDPDSVGSVDPDQGRLKCSPKEENEGISSFENL